MLQDLFVRTEDIVSVALAGGTVALLMVIAVARALWRRFVPPKPVSLGVPEWTHFEQRRWTNPGAALRLFLWLGASVVTVGGTIAVPVWLGLAQSPSWYLSGWWLGLFFAAVTTSIVVGFWISRRAVHRCATCRSASLHKILGQREWIYVCSACQIVWRTGLATSRNLD